jgi:ribosomal protein S18 acetylase RimI-like enzyme
MNQKIEFMSEIEVEFRTATCEDDLIIARHFYQLWQDNNVPEDAIAPDWQDEIIEFIKDARDRLNYQAFIAESERKIIGSVSCQLFAGLYPIPFVESYRKSGYIWGVYVEAKYRQQGIGTKLTEMAVAYLKSINCTRVVLHASPSGMPVYTKIGFVPNNEMRLDL